MKPNQSITRRAFMKGAAAAVAARSRRLPRNVPWQEVQQAMPSIATR